LTELVATFYHIQGKVAVFVTKIHASVICGVLCNGTVCKNLGLERKIKPTQKSVVSKRLNWLWATFPCDIIYLRNSIQINSDLLMCQLNSTMASYKTNIKNAIKLDNTQTVQKQYTQTT
jgi:hypothetical protein